MRLIDAEQIGLTDMEIIMCDGSYKKALEMLIDKIANAPSIDAEKHGRWIDQIGLVKCSFCQNHFTHDEVKEFNYCPNCGAKMERREE